MDSVEDSQRQIVVIAVAVLTEEDSCALVMALAIVVALATVLAIALALVLALVVASAVVTPVQAAQQSAAVHAHEPYSRRNQPSRT